MTLMNKILESDYGKEFFNQNIYLTFGSCYKAFKIFTDWKIL